MDEYLKISSESIKSKLVVFTGKQGDFFVSFMPSVNVSGYGKTAEEAKKDLEYNLDVFFEDIHQMNKTELSSYLKKLGWEKKKYHKRYYPTSYNYDQINTFDNGMIEKSYLQPAYA